MNKKYSLVLLAFLCSFFYGFGQTKIAELTFESAGGYTTSTTECTDNGGDYFIRTDGTNINATFLNIQGSSFFAAQDLDASGCPAASGANATLLLNDVNVSGYSSLEIRVHIAEDDDGSNQDWDSSDLMHFDYDLNNSGTFSNLLWVESTGGTNTVPAIDTDYNGIGDGTTITDTFTQFTNSIIGTGNLLDIRVTFDLDSGDEDIAIDNIEIWGTLSCTPPTNPIGTISGTTPACTNTSLSYTFGGSEPLTNVEYYWQNSINGTSTANNAISTFSATSTGTYYIRAYDTVATCWSTNSVSYSVTIDTTTPTITTQPVNQNEVIPNTATFSVVATSNSTETYQWQVNSGSGWNNVSTGTGGTTNSYTTPVTIATMDGDQYRCEITNICGTTTSNVATLNLSNSSPNNAQNLDGCFLDNSVTLTWNNPATPPTGGYVIFARNDMTQPTVPPNDASIYTANSNFNAAPFEVPATLGKVVYKGNGTSANITGLTEGTTYTFRIFAYNGETLTGWSNGTSGGSNFENIAQDDISNLNSSPNNNQVTLNWLRPTPLSCWDEIVIFANQGAVSITPSGDGSAYTANSVYSTANQVVYKGTATSLAVTGLTNGTNYCFKAYVRRGTTWSDGIEVCETPVVTYCNSTGNTSFRTGIRRVIFNTIDNATPIEFLDYSDFTAISTTINLGEGYDLTVHVNTDGAFDLFTRVWIDWNHDGDFNDSGEEYDMGDAYDDPNAATTNSPLSVDVPITAAIGTTRMRVSTRYNAYSTSCQTGFDGEVEDYSIIIQQPTNAEINIKGNAISIPSGFNAPYGLNNTLFASTTLGSSSVTKTYTIQNIGLANLNLTGSPIVEIIGVNPGDFAVTMQPSSTTLASYVIESFQIVFTPLADGTRTATVSISNSDASGGENPYLFDIEGTGVCASAITSTIWPTEGPEGTEITVTAGANDLTGAIAKLNDIDLTVLSSSTGELVLQLPIGMGVADGNLVVTLTTGCSSTNSFDVLDTNIGGCDTGTSSTTPSDLFISEITDATSGSSSYVEIYNGTGASINLNDYDLKIYNNGNTSPSSTLNLTGTLANNAVHLVSIGTTSCALNNLSASPDQVFSGIGGINFDLNKADAIVLEKTSGASQGEKDVFGEKGSGTWANGLSFVTDGVDFRRKNDAPILPTMTFDLTHWDIIDWTTCADSDYVNVGFYDFSLGIPPNITLNPISPVSNCDLTATLTVTATEGVVGGLAIAYQWYVLAPNQTSWSALTNGALYSGVATNTLNLLNTLNLDGYQYYCQVRENGATCYSASNAIKLTIQKAEWNGSIWINSIAPDINTIALINGNYNTAANGSFSACQLIVNSSNTITISNSTYVEVENNVTVDGNILVATQGAFVQNNDSGTVSVTGNITVEKETAPINNWYEYAYWSSPVSGETIGNGLAEAHPTRRFWFNAANFRDSTMETNNDNGTVTGQDDIDDDANDWTFTNNADVMTPGVGYAATHDPVGFIAPGLQYKYTFVGPFNNGIINSSVVGNDAEAADSDWNFIGNPYPSAINADSFFTTNIYSGGNTSGTIEGSIYLWSQNTAPSDTTNGNEVLNFSQSDYAVINGASQTAGGDMVMPNRFIPSGQGFFVIYADARPSNSGNVVFNNAMRMANTTSNSQFFRSSNNIVEDNKLWLNLTSDNGVFNQVSIAYVEGATNNYDGEYYDATRNLSTGAYSILYSIIEDSNKKFAIQGKDPNSLNLDEVIPLGFYTSIDEATLYTFSIVQFEGEFLTNNTIYIKDNLMNVVFNLSDSDYTFTSDVGEHNERFEIVFNRDALSVGENELDPKGLTIVELNDTDVKFTVGNNFQIKSVEIIDLLGRIIYRLQGASSSETYNLSNLSKSAYIAKVELSNGQIITKKAIKRK